MRAYVPLESLTEIPRPELEAVLRRLGHEQPSDDELDGVAAEPPAPNAEKPAPTPTPSSSTSSMRLPPLLLPSHASA
jgi:hypothetical protein